MEVKHNIEQLTVFLEENTLALKDVTVAAQKNSGLFSAYIIGRTALDHLQTVGVTDAMSLMPRGPRSRSNYFSEKNKRPLKSLGERSRCFPLLNMEMIKVC